MARLRVEFDSEGQCRYLVAVESIEEGDADDGRTDAGVVRQGGKGQRLHLHVDHVLAADLLQKLELLRLAVVAKGAVQSTLFFWFFFGRHQR